MKKFLAKLAKAVPVAAVVAMITAFAAHAEGETSATAGIQTAVTTALGSVQSDVMTTIAGVLPYALAIVGAVLVVTIGIKVFKRISGR